MAIYSRYIQKIVLILLLSLSFSSSLLASDTTHVKFKSHRTIWQTIGNDIVISFSDFGHYITYPLHMKGRDWAIAGSVVGVTALVSLGDKEITKRVSRGGSDDYHHDFWDAPTAYGNIYYQSAFAGGLYLFGLVSKEDDLRVIGRMLLQTLAYSGAIDLGLKFALGRQRPYTTDSQYKFKGFQTNEDYQSFPSSHTTTAFAVSTIFAEVIGTFWSRIIFYSAATLTGVARLKNNMHWASDIVFGGLLGFGTSWFVIHQEKNRVSPGGNNKKSGTGLVISPALNGITLCYKF